MNTFPGSRLLFGMRTPLKGQLQGRSSDLVIHFGTSESTKMPAIFDGLLSPDRPASVSLRHFPLVDADFVTLPQMTRRDYTPALFSLSASHNGKTVRRDRLRGLAAFTSFSLAPALEKKRCFKKFWSSRSIRK